jgi:hypothetical protein
MLADGYHFERYENALQVLQGAAEYLENRLAFTTGNGERATDEARHILARKSRQVFDSYVEAIGMQGACKPCESGVILAAA